MKTFLEYVAEDMIRKYGTDLSRTVVVFPNKRASLFLNDALARQARRPLWSPAYTTISQLFRSFSELRVADPVKLVCELHKTYTEVTGLDSGQQGGEHMALDHFYGWGQLLITDFDDIDKNMAPADKVFANLSNIHEFDDVSYLTDEQRAAIRKFFANFTDDHDSLLKQRFLRLWSRMGDIYRRYNQRLAGQGLAYEGALYRQVAERTDLDFTADRYLFVGFNLLQTVEQRLFRRVKDLGKAYFYWDFDHHFMNVEAGHYVGRHLEDFPNELDTTDDDIYRNYQRPKSVSLMTASTEDVQARYVHQWLNADRIAAGRRTAIVLCNEGLLQTVVHCLPDDVRQVNITTGYPLHQTAVASLVQRLLRKEPLSLVIDKVTQMAGEPATADDPFRAEACFRTYTLLNRLKTLVDDGDLPDDLSDLPLLVYHLFQQTAIPFHGEPAVGLQVMGVLETRNLDFDHLLILSANEGNIPRGVNDNSFIPYSLRRAYGLTTADHKAAIYAYYFYRLLCRASDVTIVYNNATTDGQTAEMSRFVLQMLVEDPYHRIARYALQAGQQTEMLHARTVVKTPAITDTLRRRFTGATLSPTAINRYMRCPLQFYYCYVEGLREPDETDEGTIDNRQFGNIFHNAAQMLYEQLTARSPHITKGDLQQLLRQRVDIERAVDAAFRQEFDGHAPTGGLAIINREVIIRYLRQLVETDSQLAPFTILKLEKDVLRPHTIGSIGITTTLGGRVDRLDSIDTPDGRQLIRVIDYKTGASKPRPLKSVDDIFDDKHLAAHTDYYLQTLLYARIYSAQRQQHDGGVAPALLFIQHAGADDYSPLLKIGGSYVTSVETPEGERFDELLTQKIEEIFDPRQPFTPTGDAKRCRTCPYINLCKQSENNG